MGTSNIYFALKHRLLSNLSFSLILSLALTACASTHGEEQEDAIKLEPGEERITTPLADAAEEDEQATEHNYALMKEPERDHVMSDYQLSAPSAPETEPAGLPDAAPPREQRYAAPAVEKARVDASVAAKETRKLARGSHFPLSTKAEARADDVAATSGYEAELASTPNEPASDGQIGHYIVRPGDTLGNIAKAIYGVSSRWRDLKNTSQRNGDLIIPGDVVTFSTRDEKAREFATQYIAIMKRDVVVKKGDTLQKISKRLYGNFSSWRLLLQVNGERITDANHLKVGTVLSYIPHGSVGSL